MERRDATGGAGYPRSIAGRLKLALVADQRNWAFDHTARNIARHLSDGCDVEVLYLQDHQEYARLHCHLFAEERGYDLIHFFWRESLAALFDPVTLSAAVQGLPPGEQERFLSNAARTTKTTSVYDHLFLGQDAEEAGIRRALAMADAYSVSSPTLGEIYQRLDPLPPPACVLPDAVDIERFKPGSPEESRARQGSDIKVGWTGNSAWGEPGRDHKGLKTIILPAIERLQREGFPVRSVVCDRQDAWIPHEQMPDFYRSLNVYVCASLSEGTPNPVLEAMACGVPVLSTDVGVVRAAFGPLQREFLVEDRNTPEFYDKLRRLVADPVLRQRLSEENIESIQAWSWKQRAGQWLAFFTQVLDERARTSAPATQRVVLSKLLSAGERIRQSDIIIKQQKAHLVGLSAEAVRQREILQRPTFRWLAKLSDPLTAWLHGRPRP